MNCVVDASVVLAALVASDESHVWATTQLKSAARVSAPQILHAEIANKLRRFAQHAVITDDAAALAHADALAMPITLYPYKPVAERVWELRNNVSAYDAWYVAVAELLDVPLVTLDGRLARAAGPRCRFVCETPR